MTSSSLRPCPACGTEVSVAAASCPRCGHPFKPPTTGVNLTDPVHLVGVVLAVIILLGFVVAGVRSCNAALT